MPHLYVPYALVTCVVKHVISMCPFLLNKNLGKSLMASHISGSFALLVARRSSFCEIQFSKITAGIKYMGVKLSIQNTLHENFHPFGKELSIHCVGGYRVLFLNDVAYISGNYGLSFTKNCRLSFRFSSFLCTRLHENLNPVT